MYCEIKRDEHTKVVSVPSPREFYMYSNVWKIVMIYSIISIILSKIE
jgi:hypothetical protein